VTSLINWHDGLEALLGRTSTLAREAPPTQQWAGFDEVVQRLTASGWTRGDVYAAVRQLVSRLSDDGLEDNESAIETLENYATGLTGWCAKECIERFPGDPVDPDAFHHYVYGGRWASVHPALDAAVE
jgi:hypothetical protein